MKRTWIDAAIDVAWLHIQKEIQIVCGIRYTNEDGQYLYMPIFDYIDFLSHHRFGTIGFAYNPSYSYKENKLTFNKFKEMFLYALERDKKEGHFGTEYYNIDKQKYHEECWACRYSVSTCPKEKQDKFKHDRVYRERLWETILCPDYVRGA